MWYCALKYETNSHRCGCQTLPLHISSHCKIIIYKPLYKTIFLLLRNVCLVCLFTTLLRTILKCFSNNKNKINLLSCIYSNKSPEFSSLCMSLGTSEMNVLCSYLVLAACRVLKTSSNKIQSQKKTFNIAMEKRNIQRHFLHTNWKTDDFLISPYAETSLCKVKQVPLSANNRWNTLNYKNYI